MSASKASSSPSDSGLEAGESNLTLITIKLLALSAVLHASEYSSVFEGDRMSPMNVFVTEGNVEIYLSKFHTTWNVQERDMLLRLVRQEEDRMGLSREHLENGERRVAEGRERLRRQRELVTELRLQEQAGRREALILQTLEKTQLLLEQHLRQLRERHEATKL
jgi:hypothetical protein